MFTRPQSLRRWLAAALVAIASVDRWTDPAWQHTARAYFAARDVDAELRPASGPWFTTLAAGNEPSAVDGADKFTITGAGGQASGWVIPRTSSATGWTVPLAGGAAALLLTVLAAGALVGRHARVQRAELDGQRRPFIGAIAHDLRTPLFTLRSYLDGLHDGLASTPERADHYLQVCRRCADTLDHLVTELFGYARMEFLDQRPAFTQVDIGALLRGAALAQQPRAHAQDITLAVDVPAAACVLAADEHLLARVVDNLIDNALRQTPEGGRILLAGRRTGAEVTSASPTPDPASPQKTFRTSSSRSTGPSRPATAPPAAPASASPSRSASSRPTPARSPPRTPQKAPASPSRFPPPRPASKATPYRRMDLLTRHSSAAAGNDSDIAIVSDTANACYRDDEEELMSAKAGVIRPGDADAELASRAARRIRDYLAAHPGADPVSIRGELAGDDTLVVPRAATVIFAQILALLAAGQGVQLIPDAAELTTQQAADFLNVSRPFLIGLLEEGEIPYRMVGTHRRIRFQDLREYRRRDDQKRRQAADELTQLSEELGLY